MAIRPSSPFSFPNWIPSLAISIPGVSQVAPLLCMPQPNGVSPFQSESPAPFPPYRGKCRGFYPCCGPLALRALAQEIVQQRLTPGSLVFPFTYYLVPAEAATCRGPSRILRLPPLAPPSSFPHSAAPSYLRGNRFPCRTPNTTSDLAT